MKKLRKEFKEFAMRGNVLDMAVGIIIGAAFGKIITSFVHDVMMPPIGLLVGKVDFRELFINLGDTPYAALSEASAAGAPTLNYGAFFNTVLDFLIVAILIFLFIKKINRLKGKPADTEAVEVEVAEPTTKECPFCFSFIPRKAIRCPSCTSHLT